MKLIRLTLGQWLVAVPTTLGSALLLGFVVAATGVFDVSATSGHFPLIEPFLRMAMHRSVDFQSRGIKEPPLEGDELVPLGAAHFHSGCAHCHGFPGGHENPIYQGMLPPPPLLDTTIDDFESRELFWIIRHGLKYAGMPGWSGEDRDDEVWAVVAFLKRLPRLDGDAYRRLVRGNRELADDSFGELSLDASPSERIELCSRCHDRVEAAPASAVVPRLAGQSATYLESALRQFRDGKRESGFMEPVSVNLDDSEIASLAAHYAGLDSRARLTVPATERTVSGERLATQGDPDRDVPACDVCHAPEALLAYPRLAGQSAAYLVGQLELWQRGGRSETDTGRTMAVIAARLTPAQIEAVAAYYEALPPGGVGNAQASMAGDGD
jgi:cytochrome c553